MSFVSGRRRRFATLALIACAVTVVTVVGWRVTGGATTPAAGAATTLVGPGKTLVGVGTRMVGCMVTAVGAVAVLTVAALAKKVVILVAPGPVLPRMAVDAAAFLGAAVLRVAIRRGAGGGCGVARAVGMAAASGNRCRDEKDAERHCEEARGGFHCPTPNSKR
jgi:hypothetical protein